VYAACRVALPLIVAKHSNIRKKVEAAAHQGFRSDYLGRKPRPTGPSSTGGDAPPAAGPSEGAA